VAGVAQLGARVHIHLGDDLPAAVGFPLQRAPRVVVAAGDGASADEPLASDLEPRRHEGDVVTEGAQRALRRRDELSGIEVGVAEQAAQVLDNLGGAALDAAEGVDPVGVVRVDVDQQVGVAGGSRSP